MRIALSLALFLLTLVPARTSAQALPDAPSAVAAATASDQPNPLPIVNGRHYRPLTEGERFANLVKGFYSPGGIAGSLYSATYRQLRDRPDPQFWATDAEGFGKRFGAAYGQRIINQGTRYTFGALLHEDNRYLICHGCTVKQKLKNSLLSDFSARHGADGHRTFSPTGILGGFSGSLVAYAFWYPNQDSRFTVERGAINALTGFATRPASHFAAELLDGHKVPFLHKKFWESPKQKEQVPPGWTGPMPPKRRRDPSIPDPPNGYADPPDPPLAARK